MLHTQISSAGASGATQGHIRQLEKASATSGPFGSETIPAPTAVLLNQIFDERRSVLDYCMMLSYRVQLQLCAC